MIKIISATLLMLFLTACSTYKMEVQQGNIINNETVGQLQKGMSKDEVMSIIGTPLLQDNFRANRWDYVYFTRNSGKAKRQSITLMFAGDRLVSIAQ